MSLFNPSRDEVRQFFFETWQCVQTSQPLTGLQDIAVRVIAMHPEYHAVLSDPAGYQYRAYFPELGETNPFLHMSLHLSILEQLSINQPVGIVSLYDGLCQQLGDVHAAQHVLLEALAETLWQAQRGGTAPDGSAYLQLLQTRVGRA